MKYSWYQGLAATSACVSSWTFLFTLLMNNRQTEMSAFRGTRVTTKMATIQHLRLKVKSAYSDDLPVTSKWEMHRLH